VPAALQQLGPGTSCYGTLCHSLFRLTFRPYNSIGFFSLLQHNLFIFIYLFNICTANNDTKAWRLHVSQHNGLILGKWEMTMLETYKYHRCQVCLHVEETDSWMPDCFLKDKAQNFQFISVPHCTRFDKIRLIPTGNAERNAKNSPNQRK
jgi:hypothetical protein